MELSNNNSNEMILYLRKTLIIRHSKIKKCRLTERLAMNQITLLAVVFLLTPLCSCEMTQKNVYDLKG